MEEATTTTGSTDETSAKAPTDTKSPGDLLLERVKATNAAAERLEKANKKHEELSDQAKQLELYCYCKGCANYFTRWHPTIPSQILCKCGSTNVMVLTVDGEKY